MKTNKLTTAALAGVFLVAGATSAFSAPDAGDENRGADTVQEKVDKLLAESDKDKDGALNKFEAKGLWESIQEADTNDDGKVTSKELHSAWSKRSVEETPSAKRVAEFVKKYDKDGDNIVTKAEAGKGWDAIAAADTDSNGSLTRVELLAEWTPEADPKTKGDGSASRARQITLKVASMINQHDKDNDRSLSKQEAGKEWERISVADVNKNGLVSAAELRADWAQKAEPKKKPVRDEQQEKPEREERKKKQRAKGEREKTKELLNEKLAAALKRFDTNKDGSVSKQEAGDEWDRVSPHDTDANGVLSPKEILKAFSE